MKTIKTLIFMFVLAINLNGQDTNSNQKISYQNDTPKSNMWGRFDGQKLPLFHVTSEDFEYPEEALKDRIQGQVDVIFKVDKDRNIIDSSVQIVNGLSKELDEEAIKFVRNSTIKRITTINPNFNYIVSLVFRITEKNWANYYYTQGLRDFREESHESAIKNFELSISFDEKEAKYYYGLYLCYSKINNIEKACASLKKAKKLNGEFKNAWKSECK